MTTRGFRRVDGRGLSLGQALGIGRGQVVALVGAGGKTTAIFRVAAEMASAGGRVVVTTTTRMYPPRPAEAPAVVLADSSEWLLAAMEPALQMQSVVVAARSLGTEGKLLGVDAGWVGELKRLPGIAGVLVEADGAAGKPFKAPAAHEPVIPAATDLVVAVVGLSVLGCPLDGRVVHRPERVAALAGSRMGEPITGRMVAAVLLHPEGSARGAPAGARMVALLNQADDEDRLAAGQELAWELLGAGAERVVIGAIRSAQPVAEVWMRE